MSERKTGATKQQIEEAVRSRMRWVFAVDDVTGDEFKRYRSQHSSAIRVAAPHLVRPDERIIALDDLRELVELSWGAEFISEEQSEARERIRALIGDDQ